MSLHENSTFSDCCQSRLRSPILISLVLAFTDGCYGATYYVGGSNASDSNAGTTINKPFMTINRAAGLVQAGDTVYIRGGTYRETIQMNKSGAAGMPILFKAYQDEEVVVSGADLVTGWSRYSDGIYSAQVTLDPKVMQPYSYQVFLDSEGGGHGRMVPQAREPKLADPYDPFSQIWAGTEPHWHVLPPDNWQRHPMSIARSDSTDSITFEDVPEFQEFKDKNWAGSYFWGRFPANPTGEGIYGRPWTLHMAKITASSPGNLTLGEKDEYWCDDPASCETDGQGAIIGGLDALTDAYEWHYLPGTPGTLYFKPPSGTDPSKLILEAKSRMWVAEISGSYIHFENITFFAGQIKLVGSNNILDNVTVKYGTHFVFRHTQGEYVDAENGNNGVYVKGDDNMVRNSEIAYSAGSGMVMLGDRNHAENCLIHDFGYMGSYTTGVLFGGKDDWATDGTPIDNHVTSQSSVLTRSTLFNSGRSLIDLGAVYYCVQCQFTYNLLYNSTLLDGDAGPIATFGRDYQGSVIAYNWIRGVYYNDGTTYKNGEAILAEGAAIYLDNGSSDLLVHHNVTVGLADQRGDLPPGGTFPGIAVNAPNKGHQIFNNTIIHESSSFDVIGEHPYANCNFDHNPQLMPRYRFPDECVYPPNTPRCPPLTGPDCARQDPPWNKYECDMDRKDPKTGDPAPLNTDRWPACAIHFDPDKNGNYDFTVTIPEDLLFNYNAEKYWKGKLNLYPSLPLFTNWELSRANAEKPGGVSKIGKFPNAAVQINPANGWEITNNPDFRTMSPTGSGAYPWTNPGPTYQPKQPDNWTPGYRPPPAAFALVSPPNNSLVDTCQRVSLAWSPSAYATSYDVYLGGLAPFPSSEKLVGTTTSTGFELQLQGIGFTWHVVARNDAASTNSNESTFISRSPSGCPPVVQNGGLDSAFGWTFYTDGKGTFSIAPGQSGNSAVINMPVVGPNTQLYQVLRELRANTVYLLTFSAKASAARRLSVQIHKHSSPYTNYGLSKVVQLSTSWQQYSLEFTSTADAFNDARLKFMFNDLASNGDTYYLDSVSLVALSPLIDNGYFDLGTWNWTFYTNGIGSFSIAPGYAGNSAVINMPVVTSNVQLYQTPITLIANTSYVLAFYAKASAPRTLLVQIHKDGSPYTDYGLTKVVQLSTSWQQYKVEFTSTNPATVVDARLKFMFSGFASNGDTYYLDSVSLTPK